MSGITPVNSLDKASNAEIFPAKFEMPERKRSWFGRYVKKIDSHPSKCVKFATVILKIILLISIIGIPIAILWIKEHERNKQEAKQIIAWANQEIEKTKEEQKLIKASQEQI